MNWTIEIREDVRYSDDTPFKVEDIIYTFETIKVANSIIDLQNVKAIEKLDETHVVFQLKTRYNVCSYLSYNGPFF